MTKMRLSGNLGFVTNSSSVVYHFPKAVLDNPKIKTYLNIYDIEKGYVGSDLWDRHRCDTVAFTKEQKEKTAQELVQPDYGHAPSINIDSDEIVIIHGDEYTSLTSELASLIKAVMQTEGLGYTSDEYN